MPSFAPVIKLFIEDRRIVLLYLIALFKINNSVIYCFHITLLVYAANAVKLPVDIYFADFYNK